MALMELQALYGPTNVFMLTFKRLPDKTWWSGLAPKHKGVLVEEFLGEKSLHVEEFLSTFTGMPKTVETKGGHAHMGADRYIFTSNIDPDEWYTEATCTPEQIAAVKRRIHSIYYFPGPTPGKTITIKEEIPDGWVINQ